MPETITDFLSRAEALAEERGIKLSDADRRGLARRFEDAQGASLRAAGAAPQPNVRTTFPPPGRIERNIRPALTSAGLLGGMTIGSGAGGVGALPGSALGAATGATAGESVRQAMEASRTGTPAMDILKNFVTPPETGRGLYESVNRAGKIAAGEALFELGTAGAAAYAPSLLRNALWRTAGVGGSDARQLMRAAEEAGVPISIKDASRHSVVRGYPRILGSFPWINTPMRKAYINQAEQLALSQERLMHKVGPVVGLARSGRAMTRSGGRAFKVFKGRANQKYETALSAAETANARIPTQTLREESDAILSELIDKQPRKWKMVVDAEGNRVRRSVPRAPSGTTARVRKFAKDVVELTDTMDVQQFRTLADDLDAEINLSKRHGFQVKQLMRLKEAMEQDFARIQAPQNVVDLINDADSFYKAGMDTFQSSTAKKFGTVNRNIFKVGFKDPGSNAQDELHKAVFKEGSPDAIRELRSVILDQGALGRPVWKASVAAHLDDVFQNAKKFDTAQEIEILSFEKVRKSLGLHNKRSAEFEAFSEMLKGTGVKPGEVERFLKVAESIFKEGIPDVNQFVRRRAILGGRKSLMKSFTGGIGLGTAGAAGVMAPIKTGVGALAFILTTRKLGKIVTSPVALRSAIEATRPGLSQAQQLKAMSRLAAAVPGIYGTRHLAGQTGEAVMQAGSEEWERRQDDMRHSIRNPLGALLGQQETP